MASTGTVPNTMPNGAPFNARNQTPADMVGNQFVSQFYTVLHSSPRYLHRFYTDESTVTHADCGIDGEPPRSTTVSTQRGISDRVLDMGFEEAVTEIWSVDSQYSQNNGVMVMVTGSLQCKGKKKRDFVQSFFLAVQEKGYFVLNDTFRYLSDRATGRPAHFPKENGYLQTDYAKHYGQMMNTYHPGHHAYYQGQLPVQNAHGAPGAIYSAQATPAAYPVGEPAPPAAQSAAQPRPDISRGQPVTPSMPQRTPASAPSPQQQKAAVAPPAAAVQPPPQPQVVTGPSTHAQQASVVHTTAPTQQQPHHAPAPQAPVAQAPPPSEAQKQPTPAPVQPAVPKVESPVKSEAPAQASAQPKQPSKPEAVEEKPASPQKPDESPADLEEETAPAAPLTYAERLKLGARGGASGKAPKPSSAPPKPTQAPPPAAKAPEQVAKAPEPAAPAVENSVPPSDGPSTTQPSADVSAPPEESITTSIFVRDLPEGVTAEKLEAAFSRFGPVKGGIHGINLKQQKGKDDFAFVEFEEAAAMQAAIEGSVIIDGRTATVMERRPMFPRILRGPGYQRGGRGGDGRGFRGGPGRSDRGGRSGRGDGRGFPGGRGDGRGEGGRDGGRGRGYSGNFMDGGRGDGGRGRSDSDRGGRRGRGPRAPQSAPPVRPPQA